MKRGFHYFLFPLSKRNLSAKSPFLVIPVFINIFKNSQQIVSELISFHIQKCTRTVRYYSLITCTSFTICSRLLQLPFGTTCIVPSMKCMCSDWAKDTNRRSRKVQIKLAFPNDC